MRDSAIAASGLRKAFKDKIVPADGESAASEFEDLADLFEQAAADGTPIREIVGEDPVEFVEAFVQNYSKGGYVPTREPERLASAIERAAGEDTGGGREV